MIHPGDLSIASRTGSFGSLLRTTVATTEDGSSLELENAISTLCDWLMVVREHKRNVYTLGNGGSAAVAGHAATDFFNIGKVGLKAMTLHESSLLTCMSNDYGYENAFARMLSQMVEPDDLVITISSSGQSMNIKNAARQAAEMGGLVVSLSGFDTGNPLRALGALNFWIDSHDYGMVEIGHQFLLHNVSDRLRNRLSG